MKLLVISIVLIVSLTLIHTQDLPESFDYRQKWKHCSAPVVDQGRCGGCWAVSVASAMTARFCIWGNNEERSHFSRWSGNQISFQAPLGCLPSRSLGCVGGWPQAAWTYIKDEGAPTCNQLCQSGCVPYTSKDCSSKDSCTSCSHVLTGSCRTGGESWRMWRSHEAYQIAKTSSWEDAIMHEIYNHGPVVATYEVRENFNKFFHDNPDGIYTKAEGKKTGGHAVMVIGWGVENGVKYWLVQNSYGTGWGAKGFFKYIRGTNLLGFEENVSMGCPNNAGCFSNHPVKHMKRSEFNETFPVVGGWTTSQPESLDNETVSLMLGEVTKKRDWATSQLISINEVSYQAVAGTNIKVNFTISINGEKKNLEALLFQSLDGKIDLDEIYEVSSSDNE